MKLDAMIQLIKSLSTNAIADDTDPANVLLQTYQTPFDILTLGDSVRVINRPNTTEFTWGDGSTVTEYDSNGDPYDAPACNWLWSAGGIYS